MTYAWHDLGDGRRVFRKAYEPVGQRSHLPTPNVISDVMGETEHPCDGRHYTSKSAFRRVTRENNCIEVGNDPARFRKPQRKKPQGIREAILRAENRIKNG